MSSTPKLSDEEKKARQREYRRRYQEKHPHRHRSRHVKSRYGITLEQRDGLLAAQGGVCAMCGADNPRKGGMDWSVDHCHDTGKVRGILCHPCNAGIGLLGHDKQLLSKAIQYLN
ncbi:endonuclease VII domain-containing protein [Bradyrhizobium barranii]